jgi:hypothetical protein
MQMLFKMIPLAEVQNLMNRLLARKNFSKKEK